MNSIRSSADEVWVLEKWLGSVNCLWDEVKPRGLLVTGEEELGDRVSE